MCLLMCIVYCLVVYDDCRLFDYIGTVVCHMKINELSLQRMYKKLWEVCGSQWKRTE